MDTVLFVCTHNSSRTQTAEGLLRDRYGDRFEVYSAGTQPGRVNPLALTVMKGIGIDHAGHTSDHVNDYVSTPLDIVITVCDDAAENCAHIPTRRKNLHGSLDDPSEISASEKENHPAFRRVRDELADWIDATFGPSRKAGSVRE